MAHAQDQFGATDYPYDALLPLLRKGIDAFGADRIIWASDHTAIEGHSWAELLFCLRDAKAISLAEKEAILGGTMRRLLDCPHREETQGPGPPPDMRLLH
jgi:predicted TIM-barrel fold metal-dependent hydrolase